MPLFYESSVKESNLSLHNTIQAINKLAKAESFNSEAIEELIIDQIYEYLGDIQLLIYYDSLLACNQIMVID